MSNSSAIVIEKLHSQWALSDEQIDAAAYTEDDDDDDGNLHVGKLSIPIAWVIMLIIFFSFCIGVMLFTCSYYYEKRSKMPTNYDSDDEDEDEFVVPPRSAAQIEKGLKLKQWEHVHELFQDDATRHSSSSDEEDATSIISDVSCESCTSNVSHVSIMLQDPNLRRLQQKPRCVLCSKFFKESDTVTESWEPTCHHHYHKDCLVKWLQRHDGCPVCKKAYVVGLKVQEP